ncbi:MAG: hypothetical protein QOI95_3599 [Acidimicrobiaceae bacterium]
MSPTGAELDVHNNVATGVVDVVDARGSLAGWSLRATVTSIEVDGAIVDSCRAVVRPASLQTVYGEPHGLHVDDTSGLLTAGVTTPVAHADAEHGGGTYEATFAIAVKCPDAAYATAVRLSFDIV